MRGFACPWKLNLVLSSQVPENSAYLVAAQPETSWDGMTPAQVHAEVIRLITEFPTKDQRLSIEGYRQVGPC